jgi:hypothetical protein
MSNVFEDVDDDTPEVRVLPPPPLPLLPEVFGDGDGFCKEGWLPRFNGASI